MSRNSRQTAWPTWRSSSGSASPQGYRSRRRTDPGLLAQRLQGRLPFFYAGYLPLLQPSYQKRSMTRAISFDAAAIRCYPQIKINIVLFPRLSWRVFIHRGSHCRIEVRRGNKMAIKNKKELTITRVYDASREQVWKAWTDPEEVKTWWGPKYFTAPHIRIDFRVGGRFVYCMRGSGPDGTVKDFWNTGEHREIVPMEKIVTTMSFADEQGNPVPASHYGMPGEWPAELIVAVVFEDIKGGKTRITVREAGIPGEMNELAGLGWNQQLDKLAEILTPKTALTRITAEPGKQEFVITCVFDAPRELVFKAYTDPNRRPQWWGPKRFTSTVERMDVRPGGSWRIVQRDPAGNEYAFHGVYHEVRSP